MRLRRIDVSIFMNGVFELEDLKLIGIDVWH
jgi:hypothetical protein